MASDLRLRTAIKKITFFGGFPTHRLFPETYNNSHKSKIGGDTHAHKPMYLRSIILTFIIPYCCSVSSTLKNGKEL